MLLRSLLCACVAVLVLAGAACGPTQAAQPSPSPPATARPTPTRAPTPAPTPTPPPAPTPTPLPPGCTAAGNPARPVSAIGDSVMEGAIPQLGAAVPGIDVDAATSRAMPAVLELVQQRTAAGTLAPVVVLHMGDNGPIVPEQLDQVMSLVHCQRRVVLINDKEPRAWEAGNDELLAAAAQRYPNAVLMDWRAAASPHPEWFAEDGIHLQPAGATAFAQLVAQAVAAP